MNRDPTYLGTVEDVRGASISVALAKETAAGLTFIDGAAHRIGQVGAFVRIPIGYLDLFGIVTQVGAGAVPERIAEFEPHGHRWMTVELIGEGERDQHFQRGLSQSPAVGDHVHVVTIKDLARIYGRPDEPRYVRIGKLASAESIPAYVNVDKLVTRHSAVLGATGSGKSTTVAGLLNALSDSQRYPSARIVVFDIHGEYANAFRDKASIFRVNGSIDRGEKTLHLPFWAMTFDELIPLTFGQLDETARGAVMERILEAKRTAAGRPEHVGVRPEDVTVDTPLPFSLRSLWLDLWRTVKSTHTRNDGQTADSIAYALDEAGMPLRGDPERVIAPKFKPENKDGADKIYYSKSNNLISSRALDALASRLRDPRLDFLFRPGPWDPDSNGKPSQDLDTLLEAWLGEEHPIVVLDLSGIPSSILNELIGTLIRILYDALFWARYRSEGGRERPLLVVLEEAHVYLGKEHKGSAASAVRRIAKEGRKYGIGAMIVSQRPSEVDDTILSQCGTLFALRMSNPTDRSHVVGTVTDSLQGLLSNLPILRTGEALVVGEAVHLPMRALIEAPPKDRRPDSSDPVIFGGTFIEGSTGHSVPGGWDRTREPGNYKHVIATWRRQQPQLPSEQPNPSAE